MSMLNHVNDMTTQGDELKKIPSEEVLDEIKVETVTDSIEEVPVSTYF
jgi:hypothetical protein